MASRELTSAPCLSSSLTTSRSPLLAASQRAVMPISLVASTLAPFLRASSTLATSPPRTAAHSSSRRSSAPTPPARKRQAMAARSGRREPLMVKPPAPASERGANGNHDTTAPGDRSCLPRCESQVEDILAFLDLEAEQRPLLFAVDGPEDVLAVDGRFHRDLVSPLRDPADLERAVLSELRSDELTVAEVEDHPPGAERLAVQNHPSGHRTQF